MKKNGWLGSFFSSSWKCESSLLWDGFSTYLCLPFYLCTEMHKTRTFPFEKSLFFYYYYYSGRLLNGELSMKYLKPTEEQKYSTVVFLYTLYLGSPVVDIFQHLSSLSLSRFNSSFSSRLYKFLKIVFIGCFFFPESEASQKLYTGCLSILCFWFRKLSFFYIFFSFVTLIF